MVKRCTWAQNDPLLIAYHDEEWGRHKKGDQDLFELLTLELFQTGLSWRTVLNKREGFRAAFEQFDIEKISRFDDAKLNELVQSTDIIRHRRKIEATVFNAEVVLNLIKEYGSLYSFFNQLPEDFSDKIKLIKKMFKHVGPSVLESFLIAAGLAPVPHESGCFLEGSLSAHKA